MNGNDTCACNSSKETLPPVKLKLVWNHFQQDKCKDITPKRVRTCPQSEAEIQEKARMMTCDSYPECNGKKLVYHCIRFKTDLVEVCAPNLRIVCEYKSGCCAVFEEGLGRVIVDPNNHCQDCPWHYYSNETSKYSTCVQTPQTFTSSTEHRTSSTEHRVTVGETDISNEFAKSNVSLNENITHVTRKEEGSSPKNYLIMISTVGLSAIVITGRTVFFCFCYKRKRKRTEDARNMGISKHIQEKGYEHIKLIVLVSGATRTDRSENGF